MERKKKLTQEQTLEVYSSTPVYFANRKGGNDQESIQLPNIHRSKTPKGKKDALKVTAPHSKHYKQKAKGTVSSQIMAKRLSKIKNSPRHTITHIVNQSRSTALERSVKYYWVCVGAGGRSLNRFYMATTLSLNSAVVYKRHLFSPREGFLTHQHLREHKNQTNSRTPFGPTRARAPGTNRLT